MRGFILAFALFASASTLALGQDSDDPAAELATFQIADGFEVRLFASERDGVVKPIQMRFDPRGRLWVIGSTAYPQIQPGQAPNDKVLIIEDTDSDGRADKTTVFAEGLMIPTGIEVVAGGVYLGHGPELLFLADTNRDDRADERRVLFRGFGTGDNHQNINSLIWGPGGELWMSQGLHARSNVETPWGIIRLDQAGLWRLWPRRQKLQGLYGSANRVHRLGRADCDRGKQQRANLSRAGPRDSPSARAFPANLEKRSRTEIKRGRHRRHDAFSRRLARRPGHGRLHQ
jgi:glucose/arabinose dehydrogenase